MGVVARTGVLWSTEHGLWKVQELKYELGIDQELELFKSWRWAIYRSWSSLKYELGIDQELELFRSWRWAIYRSWSSFELDSC